MGEWSAGAPNDIRPVQPRGDWVARTSHPSPRFVGEQSARCLVILCPLHSQGQETIQAVSGQYGSFLFMAANPKSVPAERLDSWKEIAAFLDRAERTVKRWESERGLPVHRVPGGSRGAVFAYSSELAGWLKGRSQEPDADDASPHAKGWATAEKEVSPPIAAVPVIPAAATPALPGKGFTAIRVAAWVVPLAFAAGLILLFSLGPDGIHFKALASRHVPNAEAQDLYLQGRYFWERRTPGDLNKAIDYFTQAIVKDPSDAQAYVGLADCYNLLREFGAMPPSEAFPRALSAAQRAVQLDDTSAEAHNSLAFVLFWWSWQGATAEREFKRALELNPNLGRAHHWYATFLMALHRYAEALEQMNQAQRLEPSSTAILADKSLLLYAAGRSSESISLLTELRRTQPSFSSTHDYLGRIYWLQGDYRRALAEWRRMAELRHDELGLAIADAREKGFAAGGLPALYQAQLPLLRRLADHGSAYAYNVAVSYAALGNKPQALAYLKTAFDRHEENILVADPPIPSLQNDPEYQKLRGLITQLLAR